MLSKIAVLASLMAVAMGATYQPREVTYPPRDSSCGNFPSFMTGDRIVGGEAAASPIPWQVSVRNGQSGWGHFCGGTILDATTVMCAAHCFDNGQSMSGYYIAAGIKNRMDNNGQTIEISHGVWNEAMPYEGNNNDFIILKLKSALNFNNDVGAACLPEPNHAPDATGQTCFVSGWGTLESGASGLPQDLQWVAVPTVTNEECSNAYNSITDSMICAGLPEGGKDSCQGDSGGPFVCRDNGKAVLTGVVSFGIGCAWADYPGVYARVTAVLDWVKANMGSGSPPPPGPPPPGPTTVGPTDVPSECADSWIGDNYCDDENNNAACQFDGGDCCQESPAAGWDNYCNACECLEQQTTTTEAPEEDDCAIPHWAGDNYCDDENNTPGCGFDGGDCCDNDNDGWDNYCSECACLEMPETTEAPEDDCAIPHWAGDNYCDDENNTPGCGFDGGDCCQESPADGWDNYCSDCECLEFPATTEAPGTNCVAPHWFGDNYCDDENNNAECGFDGGDCCGDVNTQYCSACECLQ